MSDKTRLSFYLESDILIYKHMDSMFSMVKEDSSLKIPTACYIKPFLENSKKIFKFNITPSHILPFMRKSIEYSDEDDKAYIDEILLLNQNKYPIIIVILGIGHLPGIFQDTNLLRKNICYLNTSTLSDLEQSINTIFEDRPELENFFNRFLPYYKTTEEILKIGADHIIEIDSSNDTPEQLEKHRLLLTSISDDMKRLQKFYESGRLQLLKDQIFGSSLIDTLMPSIVYEPHSGFPIGTHIMLINIVSKPELNGINGIIIISKYNEKSIS
jgi:hypothetical protein